MPSSSETILTPKTSKSRPLPPNALDLEPQPHSPSPGPADTKEVVWQPASVYIPSYINPIVAKKMKEIGEMMKTLEFKQLSEVYVLVPWRIPRPAGIARASSLVGPKCRHAQQYFHTPLPPVCSLPLRNVEKFDNSSCHPISLSSELVCLLTSSSFEVVPLSRTLDCARTVLPIAAPMDSTSHHAPPPSIRSTRSVASFFSIRSRPLSSVRTATPVQTEVSNTFGLPTRLRDVKHHRSPPTHLPDTYADVHTVRYFLYQLLTFNAKLVKQYPQWILETVGAWKGTGSMLREMSQNDLQKLCPLSAGHAVIEQKGLSGFPECGAKEAIGKIIAQGVGKLQGNEGLRNKQAHEWQGILQGSSARDRVLQGRTHGEVMAEDLDTFSDTYSFYDDQQFYDPIPSDDGSYSHTAQWVVSPPLSPHPYGITPAGFMQPGMSVAGSQAQDDGEISPTSSGDSSWSSGRTASTPQTSPPNSERPLSQYKVLNLPIRERGSQLGKYLPPLQTGNHPDLPQMTSSPQLRCWYTREGQSATEDCQPIRPLSHHASLSVFTPSASDGTWQSSENPPHVRSPVPSVHHSSSSTYAESIRSQANPRIIMSRQPFEQQTKFNAPPMSPPPGLPNPYSQVSPQEMPGSRVASPAQSLDRIFTPNSPGNMEVPRTPDQYIQQATPYNPHRGNHQVLQEFPTPTPIRKNSSPQPSQIHRSPRHAMSAPSLYHRSPALRAAYAAQFTMNSAPIPWQSYEPQRQKPPPGFPRSVHNSSASSSRSPSIKSGTSRQNSRTTRTTINRSSMNYPQSGVAAPRAPMRPAVDRSSLSTQPTSIVSMNGSSRAPSISTMSSFHSMSPSIASILDGNSTVNYTNPYPVRTKPSIPIVSNLAGPHRSEANHSVDRFALEQGAYLNFKHSPSVSRSEVVESEVRRMHGMVPSNLHGEGMEHNGPCVRMLDPNGRPYPTLVEQIRSKEILDGRKQRGTIGIGGLDSEPMKNDAAFYRGTGC
ncbi:hypothetical protein P154DRAFT_532283 [Amniculicola lignicola CBS 123094]|uniref:Uncharacterized protein n=1 Tax=Amniculicola lignicola CBS 123094 TaxID=1392246 RepID=A0A6A5X0T5_9PLEO|nr:hypothetical protein P154DRAFT_532283 [Amniculicola lignicola CBS 123094]